MTKNQQDFSQNAPAARIFKAERAPDGSIRTRALFITREASFALQAANSAKMGNIVTKPEVSASPQGRTLGQ